MPSATINSSKSTDVPSGSCCCCCRRAIPTSTGTATTTFTMKTRCRPSSIPARHRGNPSPYLLCSAASSVVTLPAVSFAVTLVVLIAAAVGVDAQANPSSAAGPGNGPSISTSAGPGFSRPKFNLRDFEESSDGWMRRMREDILSSLVKPINTNKAKNIIIFVGDGMGNPITVASRIFKGQLRGNPGEEELLEFERFPHTGLSKTYCVDRQVPDSACTATAMFHGVKAPFKTLGVDRNVLHGDCDSALKFRAKWPTSIAEHAQRAGMRTGFVTTTTVTHATPGALYAHTPNREWEADSDIPIMHKHCKDIARQLVEEKPGKDFNVIMGGGLSNFLPKAEYNKSDRRDGLNLIDYWIRERESHGHKYAVALKGGQLGEVLAQKPDYLLGLFSDEHFKYESETFDDRKKNKPTAQPTLEQMTIAAIETLTNDDGFFLLVEGGRIDHALHQNQARRAIQETLAFDKAIAAALKRVNLKETLILATADHSHVMTINGYPARGNPILGIAENRTDYARLPYTTLMFTNGPGFSYKVVNNNTVHWRNVTKVDTQGLKYQQLAGVNRPGGETHGGEDVIMYGIGPWAHLVTGVHEQSFIAHLLSYAACIGEYSKDPWPHCDKERNFKSFYSAAASSSSEGLPNLNRSRAWVLSMAMAVMVWVAGAFKLP